ncbi:hypothetical protein [uncultured Thiodictyon sp.]|jgi:hypothetical protein|uniref:hypothetical protein n=1 Tax=uncultured Thiodictyon sp. TaxID=1846217 RepID=UPI0025E31603|nr:hypothetical protein [uncultured Thiodictyon sp.]
MIWKFLLTAVVVLAAFFFIRQRLRGQGRSLADGALRPALLPAGAVRWAPYGVMAVMLLGSGWYLYRGWALGDQVVEVHVVNANTGAITRYQAHRRDIQGRVVRTLDGRELRLADVERMIVTKEGQGF